MKRAVIAVLAVLASLAAILGLGYLGYKHFVTNQILDGGGMENPFLIRTENRPAEGAELVYCSLTNSGTTAEDNYSYTLEQVESEVLLYADYTAEDGTRMVIDGQAVEPEALTALNTLALSLDLTETHERDNPSKPSLLDGDSKSYTLRWDDGTTATPDDGFQTIKEYFDTEIFHRAGTTPNDA